MKGTMMILAPLSLLLSWVLLGDCAPPQLKQELDMAEGSVDDMYNGCHGQAIIKTHLQLLVEKNQEPFAAAWKNAETYTQEKIKLKENSEEDKALTNNHLQAICVYTGMGIHDKFNDEVQKGKNIYGTAFPFYYLHYMLTSAIQILNNNQKCHTTYRRVGDTYTGKEGNIMRFNYFASSSLEANKILFGKETCFKIKTCSGAYLKDYSCYPDEKEVLIPPYEMFQITKIIAKSKIDIEELKDCERLIILESVGVHSNLNCKVAKM